MSTSHLKVIVAENQYGSYFIPVGTEHRPAAATILQGEVWEPETIDYIRMQAGNGDIIHAGTFFGDFLPALSSALSAEYLVHAFEPNPENFLCAELTVKINNLTNVRLHNCGLGAETTRLPMKFINKKCTLKEGGASRIYLEIPRSENIASFKEVPIVRGTEMVGARNISIIHLDIEGFEQNALLGLLPVINQHKPILILETVPSGDFLAQHFYPLGYRFSHQLDCNKVYKAE